jgi:2-C-methyl-D-erythritol 4-phosphate cytidylyltransferase
MPSHAEVVLVHDAARPLATAALVTRVLERLAAGDAPGVVPVVPVRDTIKVADAAGVVRTLDRDRLVAVQTPQGFRAAVLREAHAADEEDATDDAVLLERRNERVVTVEGEPWNLKVTYPEDLRVLEAMLP